VVAVSFSAICEPINMASARSPPEAEVPYACAGLFPLDKLFGLIGHSIGRTGRFC
jgi:hypothetical protein